MKICKYTLDFFDALDDVDTSPQAEPGQTTAAAPAPTPIPTVAPTPVPALPAFVSPNFYLSGDRPLAASWRQRALDNVAAIRLTSEIETAHRAATPCEQAELVKFIGFGASDLANTCFRRPGEKHFQKGWEAIGQDLETLVPAPEYASLSRSTQYAHFTPEFVIRALWAGVERLGFTAGRILEPGAGIGLIPSLMPSSLQATTRVTAVEFDPISARIAGLLHPMADVIQKDFSQIILPKVFDLAIGNPPFSDLIVKTDPDFRKDSLRLHDYFIVKALSRLKPGALAAFVTSHGTMDKTNPRARLKMASLANLAGAIRLPEGSFKATAGTDVVTDILFFRRREEAEHNNSDDWVNIAEFEQNGTTIAVNAYFANHPEMVLGTHATRSGRFEKETYTCLPDGTDLPARLNQAVLHLPADIYTATPENTADPVTIDDQLFTGKAADGATIREGSYYLTPGQQLMQIIAGRGQPVTIKSGQGTKGIFQKHAKIIAGLIPIRDAVRHILRLQEADEPSHDAQIELKTAWEAFTAKNGPINKTSVTTSSDPETGVSHELHRHPNLQPFLDDPDCWLVASIEDYDLQTDTARPGPIFTERVIAPPTNPTITSAADALAIVLNDTGRVAIDAIADALGVTVDEAAAELGDAIFLDPEDQAWKTADAYLSGAVRDKLAIAEAAASTDSAFTRNVEALRKVQPIDLKPSDITARLGAPWIPTSDIEAFVKDILDRSIKVYHTPDLASWTVEASHLSYDPAAKTDWGTERRHAGLLLHDALNASIPQIFDIVTDAEGHDHRVLNAEATEAAKEKLTKLKNAFQNWIWTDPDRTDRLSRIYNDQFNNLVTRSFDGTHLKLPGASNAFSLYDTQKRVIWRIISAGSTYIAHAVGAGKTLSIAASIMEQKRLGLISKAMLVVPGHCLVQAAREFLAFYPTARILVADENAFSKEKRARFLARAATANWDAIIITHSAFKFIAVPTAFEQEMIQAELDAFAELSDEIDEDDRISIKQLERQKSGLKERLQALASRKDDMVTISEMGIDQILVDEAQEFRKLSFSTNMSTLKGIDPTGSQRAWDLYVKSRFIETKNPGRGLILASGTPITNTIGEMYTATRYMASALLAARGLSQFDAWASCFGETSTELELQPSGKYKPVTRFAKFVNIPELIDMFRSFADILQPGDLRQYLKLPAIAGGKRQIITAEQSDAFKVYQKELDKRIKAIEARGGKAKPGDDIILSVISDGRHAAIDMRLVEPWNGNEPQNKLNALISRAFEIWEKTSDRTYLRPDGTPYEKPGATQMIFSDLGTLSVEAKRGFSAYRWIKSELVRLGVPPDEIAFMQHYKKSAEKQRLFNDCNAGRVRFLIGSSDTMGTGVNAQTRLKALHHLDVPWLPSQIEQREGRGVRQGNQNDEIDLLAYATLGSMDAPMWQSNERKARFISAALSGDRSIRQIEDIGNSQANQFAMAKAIASGDPRLMQKAGLEADVARLERLRSAHFDDQQTIRRRIRDAQNEIDYTEKRITEIEQDVAKSVKTAGDAFEMIVGTTTFKERKEAGTAVMNKFAALLAAGRDTTAQIGTLGGFDISAEARRTWGRQSALRLVIHRTGYNTEIDATDSSSPHGLILKLEHQIEHFKKELDAFKNRLGQGKSELAGYQPRLGEPFAYDQELDAKCSELAAIDAELEASSHDEPEEIETAEAA